MSEINFFDAFANRPYQIMVKDNNCNYSSCENTRYKEDAIEIATIYLKTYKYVSHQNGALSHHFYEIVTSKWNIVTSLSNMT